MLEALGNELLTHGFDKRNKLYLIIYEGTGEGCGYGAPVGSGFPFALLNLHGTYPGDVLDCDQHILAGEFEEAGFLEWTLAHEIVHSLGFVTDCSPNYGANGHVTDSPQDLMYAGAEPWKPVVVDVHQDDYFGSNVSSDCEVNLQKSAFLLPEQGAQLPPNFSHLPLVRLSYTPYMPLMEKVSAQGPLYTTGSEEVPLIALNIAASFAASMLEHREDVVSTLQGEGAVTGVFTRTENVCDLTYFADLQGTSTCENAPGGLGGVPGRPATGCSEKNLLMQDDDPYGRGTREDGENVCVHELAHTIMNVGLTESEREAIKARYQQVIQDDLWRGDFALTNADEFFAEMTQVYFCANPEVPAFNHNHGINCADELEAYDPDTFTLIDQIYSGSKDLR